MTLLDPKLKYTNRSFDEIKQQLIQIIQATPSLKDKWTDFNESDLGVVLLECWAAIGDELNVYLDLQANESFITTAKQRKSVVSLCKLIAYNLDPVSSAEGMVTFRTPTDLTYDAPVIIPKYTRITSIGEEAVQFVTTAAAVLPAGQTSVDVSVRQGILYEEEFLADGLIPNQSYSLERTDIAANFGAIEVFIGTGDDISLYEQWHEAPNFIIESPTVNQKRFVVETDHKDRTTIKFGDGVFGAIPPQDFTIVVRYLASAGANGNVDRNKLQILKDKLFFNNGLPALLSINNNEACAGGADRETIDHARRQAPQELSALHRAVTKADGRALIDGLAGILKANVWGEYELPHPDIKHFNKMYVTLLAEGIEPSVERGPESWKPTTAMKKYVEEFLEDKKIITTKVEFVEPEVIFTDIKLDIFVPKTASVSTVRQAVIDKIEEFFSLSNQEFGLDVRYSNLMKVLDSVPNVQYMRMKLKRNGVGYAPRSGPVGRTVRLVGVDFRDVLSVQFTGAADTRVVADNLTIISPSEVTVTVPAGAQSGPIYVVKPNETISTGPRIFTLALETIENNADVDGLGVDPDADINQYIFDEQDIYCRRHEIIQFSGHYYLDDDGLTLGVSIGYARDEDPLRAKIIYTPNVARIGEYVTFNGGESQSPHGNIALYQWSMGARGILYKVGPDGNLAQVPANEQPLDGQNFTTSKSTIIWKYTERPQNGIAIVSLMVTDDKNQSALTSIPYEIRG